MKWFKSNLPIQQTAEILTSIRAILTHIEKADEYKIACFTKVAHDGSINIFVTEELIKILPIDLKQKNKFIKCEPPSEKSDSEGSSLLYQFGYTNILSNSGRL